MLSDGDAIAVLHMHDGITPSINSREYCVHYRYISNVSLTK